MSNWNASNYRQRKAARQAQRPARWETNPETQERFFIRSVGAMSIMAGFLNSALKEEALEGWKQRGIEPEAGDDTSESSAITNISAQEAERTNQNFAKVIYHACLVPTLAAIGEDPASVQERALANCELAYADDPEWKKATAEEKAERANGVIMDLAELEESDGKFIFRCASSPAQSIPMKGGSVMQMADAKSLRKKPGIRPRTGTGG